MIPPRPTTGIFTALATCQTIRRAIGFTQAPLNPPVIVLKTGLRFLASIAIPSRVLIRETESAPSLSTAKAISCILVTLGDNFTIKCFLYTRLTAFTTSAAEAQLVPKAIPPSFTLGQEIFNSMAGM